MVFSSASWRQRYPFTNTDSITNVPVSGLATTGILAEQDEVSTETVGILGTSKGRVLIKVLCV